MAVTETPRKTRVLFVLPSLHAGGAENYVLRLVRFAGPHAFEWHVLSPNLGRGDLHDAFLAEGTQVRYQSIGYFNPVKMLRFYHYLKAGRFDVVCTLNGVFGGLTLAMANAAGVKSRVGWHRRSTPAFRPTWGRRAYAKIALWLLEKNSTRILSNGRAALDHFHGVDWVNDERFGVIPNGVDAGAFLAHRETPQEALKALGIPREGYVIGHVGRYDPAKNHETIFRVAAELIQREPTATFVFCGKGTDSAAFRQRLEHFGIASHCVALGLQPNLPRVYRSFDVFYFPSVTEGQPNALIEALLAKLPFVASDIPGVREVVPPALHAELLPPMAVNPAVEAILTQRRAPQNETQAAFDWAAERFDLARNMALALKTLEPAAAGVRRA
jgi:glycosyltransferase involved in cell wall biosynthesis